MRIVVINNIYFPEGRGGGEMVAKHRALDYANEGNDVFIIVPGEKNSIDKVNEHLSVVRFKPIHLFIYKNAGNFPWAIRLIWHVFDMFNIATYFQIKKLLRNINPDRVECHNLKGVGFFIPSAIKALNIPFAMYLHDVQLSIPSGILLFGEEKKLINNGLFQKLYEASLKSLVGSPEVVMSPSRWLMDYYIKKGFFLKSKKEILEINKINTKEIERKLSNIKKKRSEGKNIYVAFVGRLEVYKGVSLLLETWKGLPKNFILKIYGEGSLEVDIRLARKAGTAIEYFGHLSHAELLPAIKNADLLIMPTLCYENRPEVILESFAVGTPVIASDLGGVRELLKDTKRGMLFKPDDVGELKSALLEKL